MVDVPEQVIRAILFADVTDSSRLFSTYGDAQAHRIVSACLDFLASIVKENNGELIKAIGDEVMCSFSGATDAVTAAILMHQRLREQTSAGYLHSSLSLRIGVHEGLVVLDKKDVFGDAVNLAARMSSLSKAHQVMTTRATVEKLENSMRPLARFVDQSTVKGQPGAFDLYEIIWDSEAATQATTKKVDPTMVRNVSTVEVSAGGKSWVVDLDHASLSIGRSTQCDVVIEDTRASRLHAKIEYIKNRLVLKDMSTNGTYVNLEESGSHHVRRDELILNSSGLVALGRPVDPESPLLIKLTLRKGVSRL